MRRSQIASLIIITLVAIGAFAGTIVGDHTPQLGLDLQGGASVVLQPKVKQRTAALDQSIEIIRNRVDALGVAEPEIARQGDSIIVQLPGVKDQKRALEIVGQTAKLRFRPVMGVLGPETPKPTTTTTAPGATTTTAAGATTTTTAPAPPDIPTTPREKDIKDQPVVLPEMDGDTVIRRYQLGPTVEEGEIVRTATAQLDSAAGTWSVQVRFTSDGSKKFDELAAANVNKQVAIVLDGIVQSAPTIQQPNFGGTASITGEFTEREARDLALVLRYGSLPVELEQQSVQQVSASLGKDSLRAGIIAGLVGLGLVLLYIIFYYRALGVVVVLGLGIAGMLMWSIVSYLGSAYGLALSLAGATGIIVSIGVTADSYIVYFERLKDELRGGKTVRSSAGKAFTKAFRTILTADISSLIGAALLYFLTVGPVRGFAFFLGLSTLLDVIVSYFFTRPMVILLSRSRVFTEMKGLGVARGLTGSSGGRP